jgi:hypothetical protein
MAGRKAPPESVLARAADLRARGNTWEATANHLKRSPHTIAKWPVLDPDRWATALRDAQRRVIGDMAAQSLEVLRRLLHADDGRLRKEAAAFLADLRVKQARLDLKAGPPGPPVPPLAAEIARILEDYSDEDAAQLLVLLRQFRRDRARRDDRVLPGGAG